MNLAFVAAGIAEALRSDDVVYLADDEQQAEALAAIVTAFASSASVFFLPSSDTLPGEAAPASPANAGRRVAALRALRFAQRAPERPRLACILSGEAGARRYPAPEAFDAAPPTLRTGDAIDVDSISATLEELGYLVDDRVDEPGEMALRGDVLDIFPADAGLPARIDIAGARISASAAMIP